MYSSFSIKLFQEADLVSLLEQSRFHNAMAGITGILLINRESIVQVLEGRKEVIEALYERIEKDQRHTNVTKLVDQPIKERLFAEWSMNYKSITKYQLELIKTVVDLGKVDWLPTKPSANIIVSMLKCVHQNRLTSYETSLLL